MYLQVADGPGDDSKDFCYALRSLAMLSLNGGAIRHAVPQDASKAEDYLRRAAVAGDARSQWQLARLLETGAAATLAPRQALTWYEKAAAAGLAEAQYDYGRALEFGMGDNAPDVEAAVPWYKLSCEAGNANARCALGRLYEVGAGGLGKNYSVAVS
jgi:TPR repeat protein